MKSFIKYLFLIFFFFNALNSNAEICNNFYNDFAHIQQTNQKTEYITNKQNQTAIELSKKQDSFFIKNEENEEYISSNTLKSNSLNLLPFGDNSILLNNISNLKINDLSCRISHSISPLLEHSIQKRAP